MSDLISLAGTEEFLPKIHPRIFPTALFPPALPFLTPQNWLRDFMAGQEWINWHRDSSDSLECSSMPFCVAGKNPGQTLKYQSEVRTNWKLTEDHWGQHSPLLWWPYSLCVLLPLEGWFLQAHWGCRQQDEFCIKCEWPACFPLLWETGPGWVRIVQSERFRVGGNCLSPLKAHPNAMNSSCCSPLTQLTITTSALLTLICGRAQNSKKIQS